MVARVAVAAAVCLAGSARAEVILGQHDWNSGPETGWDNLYNWTSLDNGVNQNWLQVTFPTTSSPESGQDEWYDVIYVQAADLFAGTWTPSMSLRFDFFADDVTPQALQVQWQSSASSSIWGATLTPAPTTDVWTRYELSLSNWQDWMFPGATEDQYLSDLSTIDWIGINIVRTGAGAQVYGLDDVTLTIPEPPEMVMLGSAILVSLCALRQRRKTA